MLQIVWHKRNWGLACRTLTDDLGRFGFLSIFLWRLEIRLRSWRRPAPRFFVRM
jgi:hypothetical protein